MSDDTPLRNQTETLLAHDWTPLRRYSFELRRRDGRWQSQTREVYDRGDAVTLLPYNAETRQVILTRQFRMPVHVVGDPSLLIETCAGMTDGEDPDTAMRREAEEEIGLRVGQMTKLWTTYMCPGSVTERVHHYIAPFDDTMRVSEGGGLDEEGEDIEIMDLDFDAALGMIERGEIMDAKTIMLLQHLRLTVFAD